MSMTIFFAGNTVTRPGDALLVYGDGLCAAEYAEIARLNDEMTDQPGYIASATPVSVPTEEEMKNACAPLTGENALRAELLQKCNQSVKIMLPETLEMGVFAVTLVAADERQTVYVNAPSVKWAQGDEGSTATPGGWLRLSGEMLTLDGAAPAVMAKSAGEWFKLNEVRAIDAYSVEVKIPADLPEGEYLFSLNHRFGGSTAWSVPCAAKIAKAPANPETIFNVRDFGADRLGEEDATEAFRAAFAAVKENGGGVVFVPRGRYWLTDALEIPDHTTLRGEGCARSQMFYTPFRWDFGQLPEALLRGHTDITVEDIDFRGTRVCALFCIGIDADGAKNIKLRRIRANFNALAGHEFHVTEPLNRVKIDNEVIGVSGCPMSSLVRIAGDNVQITDSEFFCTGMTFGFTNGRGKENFLFRNNWVKERISGWAYFVHSTNTIIEDNEFEGCTVGFGGANAYLGRNYIHDVLNNDREAFTTDMSYSTISMHPAKAEGKFITAPVGAQLRYDRVIGGGGLYITGGRGAGQARQVVAIRENVLELDAPFAVQPDESSELEFGGTFRTAFYLVNNRVYNAGHIQFYVDQCSSVYDGNEIRRAGGIVAYSWQEAYRGEPVEGVLPHFTRSSNYFISMVNNSLADGNHFHIYGKGRDGGVDGWSGFTTIGARPGGENSTCLGLLLRNNRMTDNAFIQVRVYEHLGEQEGAATEDLIIDCNEVLDSIYGIDLKGVAVKRLLISRNTLNVDEPMMIERELNAGEILEIE